MKPFTLFFLIALSLLEPSRAATNSTVSQFLSIHFSNHAAESRVRNPSRVKADTTPILSGHDFVSFDLEKQTFTVTGPAAVRLSNAIFSKYKRSPKILPTGLQKLIPYNTAFVLKAEGKPIFAGAFLALEISDFILPPTVSLVPPTRFVAPDQKENVRFNIEQGDPDVDEAQERHNGPRDPRIAAAIKKLFANRSEIPPTP